MTIISLNLTNEVVKRNYSLKFPFREKDGGGAKSESQGEVLLSISIESKSKESHL